MALAKESRLFFKGGAFTRADEVGEWCIEVPILLPFDCGPGITGLLRILSN